LKYKHNPCNTNKCSKYEIENYHQQIHEPELYNNKLTVAGSNFYKKNPTSIKDCNYSREDDMNKDPINIGF
jgi:hypothetical protein